MSSILTMLLATGMAVPGDVPSMVSAEMEQGLDLSGAWEGSWVNAQGVVMPALVSPSDPTTEGASIECTTNVGSKYIPVCSLTDEGKGRLQIAAGVGYFGIYKVLNDSVVIAFRFADEGYPTSFRGGSGQNLLILRRVKPRK